MIPFITIYVQCMCFRETHKLLKIFILSKILVFQSLDNELLDSLNLRIRYDTLEYVQWIRQTRTRTHYFSSYSEWPVSFLIETIMCDSSILCIICHRKSLYPENCRLLTSVRPFLRRNPTTIFLIFYFVMETNGRGERWKWGWVQSGWIKVCRRRLTTQYSYIMETFYNFFTVKLCYINGREEIIIDSETRHFLRPWLWRVHWEEDFQSFFSDRRPFWWKILICRLVVHSG